MLNNLFFMNMKLVSVCLTVGLVFFFNSSFVQAKEGNLKDIDGKSGETPNVEDLKLEKKRDEVREQLIKSNFFSKVNRKLIENNYKRYSFRGEYDINYHIMELEVDEKSDETKIETIENIEEIVSQLAKENNVISSHARVVFHQK
ncbi:hypothetical protein BTA37_27300 [Priestia megaterium]|uniref:hypothetical protein n=1 Tax=Priestia megaterium TaxID=1404 RepID=UPI00094C6EC8|nr:hypothetical protein [Priestia megaterium]OLO26724.1 hypothetical protein BTA37_27300 [Priestia megaterium]